MQHFLRPRPHSLPNADENAILRASEILLTKMLSALMFEDVPHAISVLSNCCSTKIIPLWNNMAILLLSSAREQLPPLDASSLDASLHSAGSDCHETIRSPMQLASLLIGSLGNALPPGVPKRLLEEVEQQISYDALHLAYRQSWNQLLVDEAHARSCTTLWHLIKTTTTTLAAYIFFEQWGSIGHPIHPFSKIKVGMSKSDVLLYAPEFCGSADLHLLAVSPDLAAVEEMFGGPSQNAYLLKNFPEWMRRWSHALSSQSRSPERYIALPVHPWQWQHRLRACLSEELAENRVLFLDGVDLQAAASMSFRTMIPTLESAALPQIKLPISIQATSTVRSLSPARAVTAPRISKVLMEILIQDHQLSSILGFLPEETGIYIRESHNNPVWIRDLSAIFRGSVVNAIDRDHVPIALAALFVRSPISGKPLIIELMNDASSGADQEDLNYFKRYIEIVIDSSLLLYGRYGIGLEGHQQNTIMVFDRSAMPRRLLARDCSGMRFHIASLNAAGFNFVGYPGLDSIIGDRNAVRGHLLHTVFLQHIAPLVKTVSRHTNTAPTQLWKVVRECTIKSLTLIKCQFIDSWEAECEAFLTEEWPAKALLSTRLQRSEHRDSFFKISNPLRAFADSVKEDPFM